MAWLGVSRRIGWLRDTTTGGVFRLAAREARSDSAGSIALIDRFGSQTIPMGPKHPEAAPCGTIPAFGMSQRDAFCITVHEVLDAIEHNRSARLDFLDGLRVCEVIDAAKRSSVSRSWQTVEPPRGQRSTLLSQPTLVDCSHVEPVASQRLPTISIFNPSPTGFESCDFIASIAGCLAVGLAQSISPMSGNIVMCGSLPPSSRQWRIRGLI